jgi:hypothetical protein
MTVSFETPIKSDVHGSLDYDEAIVLASEPTWPEPDGTTRRKNA